MTGKQRCKYLKEIRQKIADDNDIAYITEECKHKGECPGTCPKCESELRYLECELEKRRKIGKSITVAGLAIGLAVAATGCENPFTVTQGDMELESNGLGGDMTEETATAGILPVPGEMTDGEIVYFPALYNIIYDSPKLIVQKLEGIDPAFLYDQWLSVCESADVNGDTNTYAYKYGGDTLELTYDADGKITDVVIYYKDGSVAEYRRSYEKPSDEGTAPSESDETSSSAVMDDLSP